MARSACVSCALPRGAPYAACPASLAQRRPPPSQDPALPPASCPCLKAPRSRFLEGSAPRLMRPHTLPHSSFLLLLKPRRLLQRRRSRQASRRPPDRPLRCVAASFWAGAPPPRSRAAFLSVTFNALTLCTHLPAHPEIPCTRTPPTPTPSPSHRHIQGLHAALAHVLARLPAIQSAGRPGPPFRPSPFLFLLFIGCPSTPSLFFHCCSPSRNPSVQSTHPLTLHARCPAPHVLPAVPAFCRKPPPPAYKPSPFT